MMQGFADTARVEKTFREPRASAGIDYGDGGEGPPKR
jgi:hypothetical protein